ncbi:hypothetical protein SSTU70S_05907 [Stutzerimonas stutzeri]
MEVILLEKIANLGNLGDKVNVKSGYGRNYLLPQGKATAATAANIAAFEARRAELEKAAAEKKVRPKLALRSWLNWKSPSPQPRAMKASCSVPSVPTTSPMP